MKSRTPQQHLFKLSLTLLLALALWSRWTTLPAYAQGPTVTNTEPISNALNVDATTNITVTFDTALDSATVNTQTLTIRGEQTGIYTGSYSLPATNIVLIDPAAQFKPGEVVRVVASSQIESAGAVSATPYQWQFTTSSQDGTGKGTVWQAQTINNTYDGAWDVYAVDMDGDGDMDILSVAQQADDVTWWENDGSQSFTQRTINANFDNPRAVHAVDMDGDGDMDVLSVAQNADDITWWENNGSESFTGHTINGNYDAAQAVYAVDMDGDGDMDIVSTAQNADDITWWENNGSQSFTERTIKGNFNGADDVYAADVDGDGDMDVLGTAINANDITWWTNDGSQNFTEYTIQGNFDGAYDVHAADVDGDGDLDVLGVAQDADDVTWWENDGATHSPPTFTQRTIKGFFDAARAVSTVDIDGDGDLDVLGAAAFANDITWWENDGNQSFTEHTIKGNFGGARDVYAADIDGDGDMDVLGAAQNANDITWWENDGSQNFTEQTIDGNFAGAASIYTADMDGDGDLDVLGAASSAHDITIWYNVAPEIRVLGNGDAGNGIEISNGDDTPTTDDGTDFGAVIVGTTLTHTFTISNSGTSDLTLSGSPAITLSDSTHFTLIQPLSTSLTASEATTFTLTFAPQSVGSFTTTVSIDNNDTDENPYSFVVGGVGTTEADLALSKSVTPTNANPGETITYTLTFSNVGGTTAEDVVITDTLPAGLSVQSVISGGDVVITQTQLGSRFEIAPISAGQGGLITLTASVDQPLVAGVITSTATITGTSDGDTTNNEASVGLTINNVAPGLIDLAPQSITETETLTFTVSATDNNGDSLTYGLSSGPTGTSIDSSSGVFSWTPSEAQGPASYTVTVVVSDTGSPVLTDSETLVITVLEPAVDTTPPYFVSASPLLTPTNGVEISNARPTFMWDNATDDEGAVVSYTLLISSSNDSLSIAEASTTVTTTATSFTPSSDLATGSYSWTVRAHDAAGNVSDYVSPAANFSLVADSNQTKVFLPLMIKN